MIDRPTNALASHGLGAPSTSRDRPTGGQFSRFCFVAGRAQAAARVSISRTCKVFIHHDWVAFGLLAPTIIGPRTDFHSIIDTLQE
jgi:hypothetical protein